MTTDTESSDTPLVCIYRQAGTGQCQRGMCPHHLEACPGDCDLRREEPVVNPSEALRGLTDAVEGMRGAVQAEPVVSESQEMTPTVDGHLVRRWGWYREGPVEPPSSTTAYIGCPWCGDEVKVYVWSLHGGGKRCPCGALIGGWGGVREPDRQWKARMAEQGGEGS